MLYLSAGAERKLCKLAMANVARLVKHWARVSEAASSVYCVSMAIKSRARDAEWQCIFLVHQAMCGARLHLAHWVCVCGAASYHISPAGTALAR